MINRSPKTEPQSATTAQQDTKHSGNTCLVGGVAVGGLGAASALTMGAVCPLCVIAAPALIGVGLVQRWRAANKFNDLSK